MVVVLDPSLSDVCRRLNEHRRYSAWLRTRCAAGCGRWPCGPFLRALEEMLRSSWLSHQTGCGPPHPDLTPLGTPLAVRGGSASATGPPHEAAAPATPSRLS